MRALRILSLTALLLASVTIAVTPQSDLYCGTAALDNDVRDAWESFCPEITLNQGRVNTQDADKDGDFDALQFGIRERSKLYGLNDLDGDFRELEILSDAPQLPYHSILKADADGDGDAEAVWVSTKGYDFDHDGVILPFELGRIAGWASLDDDGNDEIIIQDPSIKVGEFYKASYGLRSGDRLEVVWVGVANDDHNGYAAVVAKIQDADKDLDDDIILLDIRQVGASPFFSGDTWDLDNDGDPDAFLIPQIPEQRS